MNGIQFYLAQDIPFEFGHSLYADSPWALDVHISTPVLEPGEFSRASETESSAAFYRLIFRIGRHRAFSMERPRCNAPRRRSRDDVWAQIKVHVNVAGTEILRDDNLLSWFLDPDVQFPNPTAVTNLEPLMINTSGSLQYRPEASTEIPNLFLGSDYVRTYTDIACMEAANEAARRAVNGLLDRVGSTAQRAAVWPLMEPDFFKPLIDYDRLRFRLGLPHAGCMPVSRRIRPPASCLRELAEAIGSVVRSG